MNPTSPVRARAGERGSLAALNLEIGQKRVLLWSSASAAWVASVLSPIFFAVEARSVWVSTVALIVILVAALGIAEGAGIFRPTFRTSTALLCVGALTAQAPFDFGLGLLLRGMTELPEALFFILTPVLAIVAFGTSTAYFFRTRQLQFLFEVVASELLLLLVLLVSSRL